MFSLEVLSNSSLLVFHINFLLDAVQLEQLTRKYEHDLGSKFSILCSVVKGSKPFRFEWFKDDRLVLPTDYRITNMDEESVLVIGRVSPIDAGKYSCSVSDNFSTDTQWTQLFVKGT